MNCVYRPLPRLISFSFACAMLIGCYNAAGVSVQAKGASQVAHLGREFKLRIRRQVTLKGESLRIKFVAVKEDSRCPADVQCIWAGNAAVQLDVSIRGRPGKSLTLNTNSRSSPADDDQYHGYKLRLVDLSPYPRQNQKGPVGSVATLLVSKD